MTDSSNLQTEIKYLSAEETHTYDERLKTKTYRGPVPDEFTDFRITQCGSETRCEIKIALDMNEITKRQLLYRLNQKSKDK